MDHTDFILGIDLGQARDPTAMALVGRTHDLPSDSTLFRIPWLNELPLGTPYPAIIDYVDRLVNSEWLSGRVQLAVDYTGVGRPVVDYLRERPSLADITWAISFTSGKEERQTAMDCAVPKSTLVMGVLVAAQEGKLKIDWRIPHGLTLKRQMLAFSVTRTSAANSLFEGKNCHDDILMALSAAVWLADKVDVAPRSGSSATSVVQPHQLLAGNLVRGRNPLGLDLGKAR